MGSRYLSKAYGDLLAELQPHVITTETAIALQNIEKLLAIPNATAEEERIMIPSN
jgi:hypothetical protein